MIIDIETFKKYSNVFTDNDELQELYLTSAQEIVSSYLGYDCEKEIIDIETQEIKTVDIIPEIILMTIMRIAAILQMESDGNIAISSKSFADSGTRTFINYTDYSKYLLPISKYRKIRI